MKQSRRNLSLGQRILTKGIFAVLGVKEGDYRDWNSIKKWAKGLSFLKMEEIPENIEKSLNF